MKDAVPISVVIPAYNAERFIGEAIASVHAQTLPVSEIIVVDDGSTDRSSQVAENLGATVIRQSNRGVARARNVGIRAATTEWIALLDQDDIWEPEKIECQWSAVRLYPDVGIVSCKMRWFEQNGSDVTEIEIPSDLAGTGDGSIRYIPRVQDELPLSRMTDNPSSVLIRRDVLLSVGLFDEGFRQNEDLECFLRVVARYPLAIVERPLVHHRVHGRNNANNPLEVGLSYVKIIEKLNAEPERYPPRAAQAYEKDSWGVLLAVGRLLLDKGRAREARALSSQSLKKVYSRRGVFLWCISFFNPRAVKYLLTFELKLSKETMPPVQRLN